MFTLWFSLILLQSVNCLTKFNDTCTLSNGKHGNCITFAECFKIPGKKYQNHTTVFPCGEDDTKNNSNVCCYTASRRVGEISKQKCEEIYLNRYKPITQVPFIVGGGGYDAKAKEYPHMAALGYGDWENVKWGCGGSLINEKFILTAAHCINTLIGPIKFIRLGDLNINKHFDDAQPMDFNVTKTYLHPDYKPPSSYHDIALVEISGKIEGPWTGYIAPACLQTERNISDPKWTAIGWGETSYQGKTADHLQVMELLEADYTQCKDAYSNVGTRKLLKGVDDAGQMCAGNHKIDTCQGDSGGPLQIKNANYRTGYTVIGITSFGKPCILTNKPGVYTRVSNYIEWIESIVWPE